MRNFQWNTLITLFVGVTFTKIISKLMKVILENEKLIYADLFRNEKLLAKP